MAFGSIHPARTGLTSGGISEEEPLGFERSRGVTVPPCERSRRRVLQVQPEAANAGAEPALGEGHRAGTFMIRWIGDDEYPGLSVG